jgi:hypothetical protein
LRMGSDWLGCLSDTGTILITESHSNSLQQRSLRA